MDSGIAVALICAGSSTIIAMTALFLNNGRFGGISNRFSDMNSRFDEMNSRLDKIERTLEVIQSDLKTFLKSWHESKPESV